MLTLSVFQSIIAEYRVEPKAVVKRRFNAPKSKKIKQFYDTCNFDGKHVMFILASFYVFRKRM